MDLVVVKVMVGAEYCHENDYVYDRGKDSASEELCSWLEQASVVVQCRSFVEVVFDDGH